MERMLGRILEECKSYTKQGALASYIPELAKANAEDLGVYLMTNDGAHYSGGMWSKRFTIQSIVKPIVLLLALMDNGEEYVRARVGVEATGKPFDAINVTDQRLMSKHLNPMVNMGAITLCTLIKGENYEERFQRVLALTRKLADDPEIRLDEKVYLSEKASGNKNRALAFMLKSYGLLDDDVEEVLDCYFKACSISINTRDLAHIGLVLANRGKDILTNEQLFPSQYARYVNAILMTCGMYDGSGEFAIRVGVPAKSGVSGGIMAAVPSKMGIGIFSPAVDAKGNSVAGGQMLERLSKELELSIF